MNEKETIESTIEHLRFAETNSHLCRSDDVSTMLFAAREIRSALETFSGHRSPPPAELGGVPEARAHFIASREAASHMLASTGHDLDILANIEAATRELRAGFQL